MTSKAVASTQTIFGHPEIASFVHEMADAIVARLRADESGPRQIEPKSLALVGIHTGGAHLAERLADKLAGQLGQRPDVGALDITLYRDDVLLAGHPAPVVRGTDVTFDVANRYIVLVDDVLFTGRTVRAALDALLDLGRPSCVRLAVLIDRGLRELPVAADVVGRLYETTLAQRLEVKLVEGGAAEDAVVCLQPRSADGETS